MATPLTKSRPVVIALAIVTLIGVAVAAYAPGLGGVFVFDSIERVIRNDSLQISALDVEQLLGAAYAAEDSYPQRGLAYLTLALNYYFAGPAIRAVCFKSDKSGHSHPERVVGFHARQADPVALAPTRRARRAPRPVSPNRCSGRFRNGTVVTAPHPAHQRALCRAENDEYRRNMGTRRLHRVHLCESAISTGPPACSRADVPGRRRVCRYRIAVQGKCPLVAGVRRCPRVVSFRSQLPGS